MSADEEGGSKIFWKVFFWLHFMLLPPLALGTVFLEAMTF